MIARLTNARRPVYVNADDVAALYEYVDPYQPKDKGPAVQVTKTDIWLRSGKYLVVELGADEVAKAIGWET